MQTLQDIGIALFGDSWRGSLADAIGVDDRTLRRWTAMDGNVPPGVWQSLAQMLREKRDHIDKLLSSIGNITGLASPHLLKFGLRAPAYQETFVARDPQGLPRLFFRRDGDPLIGLDVTGLSQLKQMVAAEGDEILARQIDGYIDEAKKLGIGRPNM